MHMIRYRYGRERDRVISCSYLGQLNVAIDPLQDLLSRHFYSNALFVLTMKVTAVVEYELLAFS